MQGTVDGDRVAFKSGNSDFKGAVKGDRIELQRSVNLPWETPKPAKEEPGRPAIGPAPDGSDPSIDATWQLPTSIPVVLRRVER
jgi:beta-galactosidase